MTVEKEFAILFLNSIGNTGINKSKYNMNKIFLVAVSVFVLGTATNAQNINFKSWAETPPMGWNSYNCYGTAVMESEVKANAD